MRGIILKQGFGQTETSILCCLDAADAIRKAGSVGRPVFHAELRLVTGKPLTASEEEISRNPSSRSAKLRVAEKTDAPARGAAGSTRAANEGGAA